MANKTLEVALGVTGLTGAVLKLFDLGGAALLNTGGDALTERTGDLAGLGVYTCVVTEAITGVKRAIVLNSGGVAIAVGRTEPGMVDVAGTYQVVDDSIAADFTAALLNRIADHVKRRTQANTEASSDGDTLDLLSLYGFVQQVQESAVAGSTMTVKKTDGTTTLGTRALVTDAASNPITGVS